MVLDLLIGRKPSSKGKEKLSRSILKSISWRLIGTIDTIIICYIVTGDIRPSLSIGSVELITKMSLYFIHERLWNRIQWGKNNNL